MVFEDQLKQRFMLTTVMPCKCRAERTRILLRKQRIIPSGTAFQACVLKCQELTWNNPEEWIFFSTSMLGVGLNWPITAAFSNPSWGIN